jgi:HEAT repeat protein
VLQWIAAEEGDDGMVATTIVALRRMHCPESARALLALAADPARRDHCLTALSGMERRAIPWVAEGLKNDNHQVRSAAVEALARMKDVQATAHLVGALDDAEASVRLTAIAGLSKLGASAGQAKLAELVRSDPDVTVRRAAQHALGAARDGE